MNIKNKIIISVGIIILILAIGIPKYKDYCKKCVQTCGVFTGENLGDCFTNCWCPNIAPQISNIHVDDRSTFDIEKNICVEGYTDTPKIQQLKHKIDKINTKPNIIMFVVDDLDEMISPYMDAMKFTKELFKLNGTHYSYAYTSTPYCCPSRSQILTGLYPHNNGVLGMHGPYGSVSSFRKPHHLNGTRMMENNKCINNEDRTINAILKKYGGYHTSIIGKDLNGKENVITKHFDYICSGWDEIRIGSDPHMYAGYRYAMGAWSVDTNKVCYEWHSVDEKDYITDVIRDHTLSIIDKHKNSKNKEDPMFMKIATTAPHLPITCAMRHKDKLLYWRELYDKYVSNRKNYNYMHDTEPEWIQKHDKRSGIFNEGLKWNKLEWEKRMCSLYAIDEMIEAVYNKLKYYDQIENTVFVFVSDNGYNLGAHGLFNKMAPYEESNKVPYYISGPGFEKNFKDDRLVALIDLAPTFLEIAGLQIPDYMNGISLLDSDIKSNTRNTLLFQFKNNIDYIKEDHADYSPELEFVRYLLPSWMTFDFHPYVGIRTKKYVLIEHNVDGKHKESEMYDMINDPHQMKNIYDDANYTNIKKKLENKLSKISKCVGRDCIM